MRALLLFLSLGNLVSGQSRSAIVKVLSTSGQSMGLLLFHQDIPGDNVTVSGTLNRIQPDGNHGMHVHTFGDLSAADCSQAAGHFNPTRSVHGGLSTEPRHIGDLGNIQAVGGEAAIRVTMFEEDLPMVGPFSIIGRMLAVHEGEDNVNVDASNSSDGNSGPIIGCGVIGISSTFEPGDPAPEEEFTDVYTTNVTSFKATARIMKTDGSTEMGVITIELTEGNENVAVTGTVSNIDGAGLRGVAVREHGDLSVRDCRSSNDHYSPNHVNHGGPTSETRHLGDLGNVEVADDGTGTLNISIPSENLPLTGVNSVIGRMLVIHTQEDDLGIGKNNQSLIDGNGGDPIGCGVIGFASDFSFTSTLAATRPYEPSLLGFVIGMGVMHLAALWI